MDDALLDLVLQRLNDDHVPSEVSNVLFAACGSDDEPPSCSLACAVILASLLFALDQLRHRSARVRERAKRHQSFVPIQIAESDTFSPRPPCRVMRHSNDLDPAAIWSPTALLAMAHSGRAAHGNIGDRQKGGPISNCTHGPHPHTLERLEYRDKQVKTADVIPRTASTRFNSWLAVKITGGVSTMWCAPMHSPRSHSLGSPLH